MNYAGKIKYIILFFVVGSLVISVYTLFRQSIRLDEAQSLWVSSKSVPAIIQYVIKDVHVPLYEVILHFWMILFGANIIAARALSLLFFLLSLPILYLIAKKSSDRDVALLTVALYCLSPFILWYSFEARMYTLFILAACLSHFYFLKMIRSRGNRGEVGYFFSTLCGLYTHYFFLLLLFTQGIYFTFLMYRRYKKYYPGQTRQFIERQKREIVAFLSPVVLALLFFLPWVGYFVLQGLAANTQPLIPEATIYDLFQTIVNFLFGFPSQILQSVLVALWPLAVIPIFFLFSERKIKTKVRNILYFILVTVLPVAILFLVSYVKPVFLARYLIFVTPSFFFLLAWVLFHISKQLSAVILGAFTLVMFVFVLVQNISAATPVKENYQAVAKYLDEHVTPSDLVAITSPFTIYPIEYYYHAPVQIVTIPKWDVYSVGSIPPYTTPEFSKDMKQYAKTYENIYVVLSYDQGYQHKITTFLDTHYQRLFEKKFSSGLQLREYKLRY